MKLDSQPIGQSRGVLSTQQGKLTIEREKGVLWWSSRRWICPICPICDCDARHTIEGQIRTKWGRSGQSGRNRHLPTRWGNSDNRDILGEYGQDSWSFNSWSFNYFGSSRLYHRFGELFTIWRVMLLTRLLTRERVGQIVHKEINRHFIFNFNYLVKV